MIGSGADNVAVLMAVQHHYSLMQYEGAVLIHDNLQVANYEGDDSIDWIGSDSEGTWVHCDATTDRNIL